MDVAHQETHEFGRLCGRAVNCHQDATEDRAPLAKDFTRRPLCAISIIPSFNLNGMVELGEEKKSLSFAQSKRWRHDAGLDLRADHTPRLCFEKSELEWRKELLGREDFFVFERIRCHA